MVLKKSEVEKPSAILLSGPTGVGKSSLAIETALRFDTFEIINADSVLFYRGFDIGSAKPTSVELQKVPHHLIDICDADQPMDVARFKAQVEALLQTLATQGKRAIIVGGGGFYLKALRYGIWDVPGTNPAFRTSLEGFTNFDLHERLKKIDEVAAQKIAVEDRYRVVRALEIFEQSGKKPSEVEQSHNKEPDSRFQLWIVDRPKEVLEAQLRTRVQEMLRQGWIEETENLRKKYSESRALRAVGYHQILEFLDGKKPEGREMRPGLLGLEDEIVLAHRQLAKSQRTWMRGLKPEGTFELDRDRSLYFQNVEKWLRG